jgi:hypothetical protein
MRKVTRKKLIALATLVFLCILWFISVDWSWFEHHCPDCGYRKSVAQYRIFAIPVHEQTHESPTLTQHVAEDLGTPCGHENSESWHKHRLWGLCVCKSPCINGIMYLSTGYIGYSRDASAKIQMLAEKEPTLRAEFTRRVLEDQDLKFVPTVLSRAGVDLNEVKYK